MLKKIGLSLLLIFSLNLNGCCCKETTDDRNNNDLVLDIAFAIAAKEVSIADLSEYVQTLPSFLLIFGSNVSDVKNVSDVLATKILRSYADSQSHRVSYSEPLLVGTVYLDALRQHVKDVRKAENIKNVESKCIVM